MSVVKSTRKISLNERTCVLYVFFLILMEHGLLLVTPEIFIKFKLLKMLVHLNSSLTAAAAQRPREFATQAEGS